MAGITRPFDERTALDHLNTELLRFSDPHPYLMICGSSVLASEKKASTYYCGKTIKILNWNWTETSLKWIPFYFWFSAIFIFLRTFSEQNVGASKENGLEKRLGLTKVGTLTFTG